MNDVLSVSELIHITGFHTLCKGLDLKSGFNMHDEDVKPIDAPVFIPAGSSVRYASGDTGGSSVYRDILN